MARGKRVENEDGLSSASRRFLLREQGRGEDFSLSCGKGLLPKGCGNSPGQFGPPILQAPEEPPAKKSIVLQLVCSETVFG